MADVTIVGGGIVGLCSAYYLHKSGLSVEIIDRGDITDGCSFGNMGYISPSHFVPLASPGIISEGIKYMLSSSSPFYIKPRLSWDLVQWAWHFYKNSNADTVKRNAPHLNDILHLSRERIMEIKDSVGADVSWEAKGCLMMCLSQKTLEHEFELVDAAGKFGLITEKLYHDDVQALEPDVEVAVAGALLFKDDAHFHPGKMMLQLKSWLEAAGVQFRLQTTVLGFEKNGSEVTAVITDKGKINTNQVVISAGSWLPELAKKLGIKMLLQPGKGYSYTYDHVEKNIKYPAILVDGRCAITPWGNQLRIGGTMELSGINHDKLYARMRGIYDSAKRFYPGLEIDLPPQDKVWCGLRPVTPDGLPYIGKPTSLSNTVFAGGHAMLGISQGSGTGVLVSQLVQNQKTEINVDAFRIERFG